jgi:RNA polymerase sigma-70 factor (ECF subfamily)
MQDHAQLQWPLLSAPELRVNFVELIRVEQNQLFGLAFHLLGGDRELAKEVLQEALLKAHRAWPSFRGEAQPRTWLTRIVVNQCHNARRWRALRLRWLTLVGHEDLHDVPAPPNSAAPELRSRIVQALERLSQGQRSAFILVHMHEHTVEEAAEILNKAPGTVKSHVHRALVQLRRDLSDLKEAP